MQEQYKDILKSKEFVYLSNKKYYLNDWFWFGLFFILLFLISGYLAFIYLNSGIPISVDSYRYMTLSFDISNKIFPTDGYLVPMYSLMISIFCLFSEGLDNFNLVFLQLSVFLITGLCFFLVCLFILRKYLENKFLFFSLIFLFFSFWNVKYLWILHADSFLTLGILLFMLFNIINFDKKYFALGILCSILLLIKLNFIFLIFGLPIFLIISQNLNNALKNISLFLIPIFIIMFIYFFLNNSVNRHVDFYSKNSYWGSDDFFYFLKLNLVAFVKYSFKFFAPDLGKFNIFLYLILFWIMPIYLWKIKKRVNNFLLLLIILIHSYILLLILIRSLVGLSEITDRTMFGYFSLMPFYLVLLFSEFLKVHENIFLKFLSYGFLIFVIFINSYRVSEHLYHKFYIKDYLSFNQIVQVKNSNNFLKMKDLVLIKKSLNIFTNNTPLLSFLNYGNENVTIYGMPFDPVFKGDFFIDLSIEEISRKKANIISEFVNGSGIIFFINDPSSLKFNENIDFIDCLSNSLDTCKYMDSSSYLIYKSSCSF